MRDTKVLKVFHAARQDVEIFNNLGAIPEPLFDTQIAGMAAGFGEQVAYDALVRQILKVELDKSHRFTDWARRPLSEAQLDLRARRRHPPGRALSDPAGAAGEGRAALLGDRRDGGDGRSGALRRRS